MDVNDAPVKRRRGKGKKFLPKKKITYKRSSYVLSSRCAEKMMFTSVLSSFSPSAPAVRSVAVPGFIELVGFGLFCKARGLKEKDFFNLLLCYVYTVVSADKFFCHADLSRFAAVSLSSVKKFCLEFDRAGLLQPVQTGQRSVNWRQWKQPLTPKKRYMIAVKGNNLLVEYWDYCQQLASNFTLDYANNLPDIDTKE